MDAYCKAGMPRPGYIEASRVLQKIFRGYDISIDTDTLEKIQALLSTMECIDRYLDGLHPYEKPAFCDCVERSVREGDSAEILPAELHSLVVQFRALLSGVQANTVADIAAEIFQIDPIIGSTTDVGEYLELRSHEGELAGKLLSTIMDDNHIAVQQLCTHMGRIGNILDTLHDIRDDHAAGEVCVQPSLRLYSLAILQLGKDIALLILSHPHPSRTMLIGAKFAYRWGRKILGFSSPLRHSLPYSSPVTSPQTPPAMA